MLVILAHLYIDHTGIAISTLGARAAGNDRLFARLFGGLDCYASSLEAASGFFLKNWPGDLAWPFVDGPQPCRLRCSATEHDLSGESGAV